MQNTTQAVSNKYYDALHRLKSFLDQRILGQHDLTLRLLIALLSDGHLLVEGAPGLAKTKAVKELSSGVEGSFQRIQFTPDLLPGDLTGTEIYRQQEGNFTFQPGPIFHNLVLADEINRAPAKVQSALLEAMAERQVTVGGTTYMLPKLFLVMATQNPIEQEGTYPLPEAQLDRFLMHVKIDYPNAKTEHSILELARREAFQELNEKPTTRAIVSQDDIFMTREAVLGIHISKALEEYLVELVLTTRNPKPYGADIGHWIRYGASPRATIGLDRCAKAHAWLHGRDYVSPEDIHAVCHNVLRHRILLSFEAEAEGITPDDVISEILNRIAVP